jgi:hypothetical protein
LKRASVRSRRTGAVPACRRLLGPRRLNSPLPLRNALINRAAAPASSGRRSRVRWASSATARTAGSNCRDSAPRARAAAAIVCSSSRRRGRRPRRSATAQRVAVNASSGRCASRGGHAPNTRVVSASAPRMQTGPACACPYRGRRRRPGPDARATPTATTALAARSIAVTTASANTSASA